MATARKLPSGSWRCMIYDYTDEHGKRKYKSFTGDTKKEAESLATTYALEKDSRVQDHQSKFLTFGEALDLYIQSKEAVLSPTSVREYKRAKKNYDDINNIKLYNMAQSDIQKHVNTFFKTHSPKSCRDNHALITAVLKKYRPDFAVNTTLPQKLRPDIYIPTDEDVKAIMRAAKDTEMEIQILLAAFGPMRRGEICALRAENIDGNIVHVCENMVLDENRKWIIKAPKSFAGDRFIDFPEYVINKIETQDDRVTELNPNQITSRFHHILIAAGVPHMRFHDLRHYSASILHAIGIPDAYIMERGGWGNDSTLKSVYRHTMTDKGKEMTEKANTYFSQLCNTKCNTK